MAAHPEWNWGVILQQAWSLYLKSNVMTNHGWEMRAEAILPLHHKRGAKGEDVKFVSISTVVIVLMEWRVSSNIIVECGKLGHGAFCCRRAGLDRGSNNNNNNYRQDKFHYKGGRKGQTSQGDNNGHRRDFNDNNQTSKK